MSEKKLFKILYLDVLWIWTKQKSNEMPKQLYFIADYSLPRINDGI